MSPYERLRATAVKVDRHTGTDGKPGSTFYTLPDGRMICESPPAEFVAVNPTVIYIGIEKREDFDKIALPVSDRGEHEDGQHVLVKSIGADGVHVFFQHWIRSTLMIPATASAAPKVEP